MQNMQAILVGHEVVPVDFETYIEWMAAHKYGPRLENYKDNPADLTRVGWDEVDGVKISTVFLGLDHGFGMGPPQWFETMVFGGACAGDCERYATWDEAAAGHRDTVDAIRAGRSIRDECAHE